MRRLSYRSPLGSCGHRDYDFSPCSDDGNNLENMLSSRLETLTAVTVTSPDRFGGG